MELDELDDLPMIDIDEDEPMSDEIYSSGDVSEENVNIETMDDIWAQVDEDVVSGDIELDTCITMDFNDWMENDYNSPKKFKYNLINEVSTEYSTIRFLYENMKFAGNSEDIEVVSEPVYLCVASIKSAGYILEDISPANEENTMVADELILYGHDKDYNDDYHSRFDDELIDLFKNDFKRKFKKVSIFGFFKSVEDLKHVCERLYELLVDKTNGTMFIYLDTKIKDDENNVRTLANMLASGYIPGITCKPYNIKYRYKRFSKLMTARLFKDKLPDEIFEDGKIIYKIKENDTDR